MFSDPIADMATRIRNALGAGHESVEVPGSRLKKEVARVLKEEGFIEDFSVIEGMHQGHFILKIYLKYSPEGRPAIHGIKRVSKPGCRVYVGVDDLPKVKAGLGIAVLSTTKGVLASRDARNSRVGGEVLLYVW